MSILEGGGVIILTKQDLQVSEIKLDLHAQVELIAIKISKAEGSITVATLYMPPHTRCWEEDERNFVENTAKYQGAITKNRCCIQKYSIYW